MLNLVLIILFLLSTNCAKSEGIRHAYLDRKNNVHIVGTSGFDRKITATGNATSLKLAPNNAVAWLVMTDWIVEGDTEPLSEELQIYLNGNIRSISCGLFIRDYWFWQSGDKIALDCGGRRFAGWEILYDTKTLKKVASFDQAEVPSEMRPHWSQGD